MSASPPIVVSYDGESFRPVGRYQRICDKEYVIGETYRLAPVEERSAASHAHYFASLEEAWNNLPEPVAKRFPTSTHLRKWALCKAGYADERSIVCSSSEEAQRIAAFVRNFDHYAVITVQGNVVRVFSAQSQSKRSMGAKAFQESKTKVLDIVSELIGVERDTLVSNAGVAA